MATISVSSRAMDREHRFFLTSAIVMTLVLVSGFSMSLAMGRSSFRVPFYVHAHAFVFFGWAMLYLLQNALVATGSAALHRRLGWLAVGWIPALMFTGTFITVEAARTQHIPFFFQPAYFVVMDPLSVYAFAGLATAAILLRKQTLWHRRLMFSGMAILMGPGIGRLIPMPFLIPYAGDVVFGIVLLFPLAGIVHDLRASGRIHPAWLWGVGSIVALEIAINAITFSPAGPAIYRAMTAGSPGAADAPLEFAPPPWAKAK